jgi:transcription elongation factor Elf1
MDEPNDANTKGETMAKASKVFEGLRCPHCGEVDSLDIKVETLIIECRECSEEVTQSAIDKVIAKWSVLFAWIDTVK